jgi:CRISPR/Cas system CSM-associated protein Csm2 small subunit
LGAQHLVYDSAQTERGVTVNDEHLETATVKVSMRDIYLEVQRQGRLLEKIANALPDSEQKIDDHEIRIRKLEQRMWQAIGVFGFLAAIISPLVAILT